MARSLNDIIAALPVDEQEAPRAAHRLVRGDAELEACIACLHVHQPRVVVERGHGRSATPGRATTHGLEPRVGLCASVISGRVHLR